jgi:hypothetical protein
MACHLGLTPLLHVKQILPPGRRAAGERSLKSWSPLVMVAVEHRRFGSAAGGGGMGDILEATVIWFAFRAQPDSVRSACLQF